MPLYACLNENCCLKLVLLHVPFIVNTQSFFSRFCCRCILACRLLHSIYYYLKVFPSTFFLLLGGIIHIFIMSLSVVLLDVGEYVYQDILSFRFSFEERKNQMEEMQWKQKNVFSVDGHRKSIDIPRYWPTSIVYLNRCFTILVVTWMWCLDTQIWHIL